ncbi:MAG: hypothetical protein HRT91_02940 [Piscirickettsiaceae bacterium]|nr:hypothetical protein [Piscirickettsiaceae bacterium]
MTITYNASTIEALTGLETMKTQPSLYKDISHPNNLAQEIIDNSIDEAVASCTNRIQVILHTDNLIEITNNGIACQ